MGRKAVFPMVVREGAVGVKIYRCAAASTKSGFAFVVSWIGPDGRERESRTELAEAIEFAQAKARLLANGIAEAGLATRAEVLEAAELRAIAAQHGVSVLVALREWDRARQLVGDRLLEACHHWVDRPTEGAVKRIGVTEVVALMVAEKNRLKKQGDRVYKSKLKYAADHFGNRLLDTITEADWSDFLEGFSDAVTRNDIRKRLVTLCRWAVRKRHLPRHVTPAIEETERAKERTRPIGIITPAQLVKLLEIFREEHVARHLGALVLANFCGLRVEEIHGKREDSRRRQMWEDIHLDRGFLSVSAAKENTPSNRIVNLSTAAIAWLRLAADMQGWRDTKAEGPVCEINAVTRIRDIAKGREMKLPENCFRHSWISYRIALTGDKASTATEAGNSVKEIDKRYRVPLPKFLGEQWFAIMP